jgi:L-ascorbate metabolism protein UlaG (beta-lactamase superfamily)
VISVWATRRDNARMVTLTHIDTACVLLEVGGWRLLTDPVFDPPGGRYWFGWGTSSRKTGSPALAATAIGPLDAVLLSHHQHGDNLDRAGRAVAASAPLVVSTPAGARAFAAGLGLRSWATHVLQAPGRADLEIAAVPARHRPAWIPAFAAGPATGFLLTSEALPRGSIYITGDTVLYDGVRAVADHAQVDVLVAHVGAVRFPRITGPARFTMNATEVVELARLTGARVIVPVHAGGWTHFREGLPALVDACRAAGLADRLRIPVPGEPLWLD